MNQPTHPAITPPVRVLIVDDHPNTAAMLARAISTLGDKVEVRSATSGREALECIQSGAADILITDVVMPEMNGFELLEKLQNHSGDRPSHTILITAYDMLGLQEIASRLKVDEIIVKPVRPERLCQIVQEFIKKKGQTKRIVKQEKAAARKFKILIADDLPDNVALLARYLEHEGYDYITAADGVEAVDKVRAELPDLVLLDIQMPNKDGFAALEEIRADPSIQHIPVIILTAVCIGPADIRTGLNLGADDYLTKPFDRLELMARIHNKLYAKEAEDAMRHRNRELSVLLDATEILNSRGKLDEMLDAVLHSIVMGLDVSAGYLLNFNDATEKYFPASCAELNLPQIREFLDQIYKLDGTRIIENVQKDAFWRAELGEAARSAVVVSMSNRLGNLLGAILLMHKEPNYFTAEHVSILLAIANQVVVAIENAGWYATLQGEHAQA